MRLVKCFLITLIFISNFVHAHELPVKWSIRNVTDHQITIVETKDGKSITTELPAKQSHSFTHYFTSPWPTPQSYADIVGTFPVTDCPLIRVNFKTVYWVGKGPVINGTPEVTMQSGTKCFAKLFGLDGDDLLSVDLIVR